MTNDKQSDRHDLFMDCMAILKDTDQKSANTMISRMIDRVLQWQSQQAQGALRYTHDGALAECPCCASLDVGACDGVAHCYGCGLSITKPSHKEVLAAWNRRAHPPAPVAESEVDRIDRQMTQVLEERDHWEEKATELAEMVGKYFGFDVGEHSSANCPVQTALDADWKPSPVASLPDGYTLVPIEPTAKMLGAFGGGSYIPGTWGRKKYAEMLAATPEPVAAAPDGAVQKICDLPKGARFSYPEYPDAVWVVIENHGSGICARWEGLNLDRKWQSMCSIAESEEEFQTLEVIVREPSTPHPDEAPSIDEQQAKLFRESDGGEG